MPKLNVANTVYIYQLATLLSAWLAYSVARWLSPKPAKSRHKKLLDPAKNHVTNFQLKSA